MFAADFTGTWNGTIDRPGSAGQATIHLRLQQAGNELKGSIGPNTDKQLAVTKSVITGNRATIEAAIPNGDGRLVLTAQLDGQTMSGELKKGQFRGRGDGRSVQGFARVAHFSICWRCLPYSIAEV